MIQIRIPRGLWDDLEQTVIYMDRQIVAAIARELGLNVAETIRRILGTGSPQLVMISAEPLDPCPWYDLVGGTRWRPCIRQRMGPTRPCQFHERPGPKHALMVDAEEIEPFIVDDRIYWTSDVKDNITYREDGTIETEFKILFFNDDGVRCPILLKTSTDLKVKLCKTQ